MKSSCTTFSNLAASVRAASCIQDLRVSGITFSPGLCILYHTDHVYGNIRKRLFCSKGNSSFDWMPGILFSSWNCCCRKNTMKIFLAAGDYVSLDGFFEFKTSPAVIQHWAKSSSGLCPPLIIVEFLPSKTRYLWWEWDEWMELAGTWVGIGNPVQQTNQYILIVVLG